MRRLTPFVLPVALLLLASGCVRLPQDQGRIAWMSSPGTNYDIWLIDSAGGTPTRLTDTPDITEGAPAWSPDHRQLLVQGFRDGGSQFYLLDAMKTGVTPQPILAGASGQSDTEPAWSPDGRRIAFISDRDGDNRELYVMNLDGSGLLRLTNTPGSEGSPDWSPDGSRIVFQRFAPDPSGADIFSLAADGRDERRLTNVRGLNIEAAWNPDGRRIAFMSDRDGTDYELYMMNADGLNQVRLTRNKFREELPAWSPDGHWLVYAAEPDGNSDFDLYVMQVDGDRKAIALLRRPGDDRWPAWR